MISGFELDQDFTHQRENTDRNLSDLEIGITMPKQGFLENAWTSKNVCWLLNFNLQETFFEIRGSNDV